MDVVVNYLAKYPAEVREAVLGRSASRFWRLFGASAEVSG
jgi:hypothetical protein